MKNSTTLIIENTQPQRKTSALFIRHQSQHINSDAALWLEKVKECLLPQLDNLNYKVSDLAYDLNYSERNFFRKIKQVSGLTANAFIRHIRLEKARELLLSGRYHTLKHIAYQVGYIRVDYFSNLYEAKYNQRPIELLNNF